MDIKRTAKHAAGDNRMKPAAERHAAAQEAAERTSIASKSKSKRGTEAGSSGQRPGKQMRRSREGPSNQRAVKQPSTAGSSEKYAYGGRGDGNGTCLQLLK